MRPWADSSLRKQAVVDRIVRNPIGWRPVDWPERTALEVSNDFGNAIHASDTHGVEELRSKFRKDSANAATGDHRCSGAPKKIGELAHAVEVWLEASQEDDVVPRCIPRVEGAGQSSWYNRTSKRWESIRDPMCRPVMGCIT